MKKSRLDALLDSAFGIRPGEGRRALLMFALLLVVVSAVIVGRTVRDALVLARYPIDQLPLMYVGVALCVSVAAYGYSRVADKRRRDTTLKASLGLAVAAYTGAWALLYTEQAGSWMYPTLYMLVEIVAMLSVVQFWTFANDIYSAREAKRLFGFIGAGGVLASILIGFFVGSFAKVVGPGNLLLLAAGLLTAGVLCVVQIAKGATIELDGLMKRPRGPRFGIASESGRILHSRHLQIIAGMVIITILTVTLVDYQFKRLAYEHFSGDEHRMASFFGFFYAATGLLSTVIQFVITGRILRQAGIVLALLVLPVTLLGGVVSLLMVPMIPAIVAATLTKGAENTFRYTINDATMQLLYVPVPTHQRGRAKAFIDGILKPIAIGLSGLLILGLSRVFGEERVAMDLAFIDLALLTGWLVLVFSIRSEYVRSLLETLRSRRLNVDGSWMLSTDDTTKKALKSALASSSEADVIHALELVKGMDMDLGEHVPNLLDHPSETVRTTTLRLLERKPDLRKLRMIESRLHDPSDEVRAAAVAAYCAISGAQSLRAVLPSLDDPSASVRAAAVAGLVRYAGIDGVLAAAETLKKLFLAPEPRTRAVGARVLADIQVQSFYQPLLDLLEDPALEVRLAAIEAAGTMGSPELVPRLLQKLKDRETARAARRALVGYGDTVEPVLLSVLRNREEDSEIRRGIPDILARIGGPKAFAVIVRQLKTGDRRLRTALAKAASRMRERIPHLELDVELLHEITTDEIRAAYQDLAVMDDLGLTPESLLGEALYVRSKGRIGLIFRLLEIRYPPRTIQLIYTNLYSETKAIRANAVELADNILSSETSRLLLPLLDSASIADTLTRGEALFELTRSPRRERLEELLGDAEPWVVSAALWEMREGKEHTLVARAMELSTADDPLVRETLGVSLSALAPLVEDAPLRARLQTQAERLEQDAAPAVRAAGQNLNSALRASAS